MRIPVCFFYTLAAQNAATPRHCEGFAFGWVRSDTCFVIRDLNRLHRGGTRRGATPNIFLGKQTVIARHWYRDKGRDTYRKRDTPGHENRDHHIGCGVKLGVHFLRTRNDIACVTLTGECSLREWQNYCAVGKRTMHRRRRNRGQEEGGEQYNTPPPHLRMGASDKT
jgi:hypothetical protein